MASGEESRRKPPLVPSLAAPPVPSLARPEGKKPGGSSLAHPTPLAPRPALDPISPLPLPQALPSLGLPKFDLKLDLTRIEDKGPIGDRPSSADRAPPTPTAEIVARIKAQQGSGAPGTSAEDPPRIKTSQSTPALLSRADLNIGKALADMTVAELSEALSSSSRSLLGGASWAVDVSEIDFGRRLGAGAYGEVYEAKWRRSRVAVKRLLTGGRWQMEEKSVREFFAEMEILSNARHENIVRFLGGCVQPDNLCILFEYCPQSLYDLLRSATEALSLERLLRIARQVAKGGATKGGATKDGEGEGRVGRGGDEVWGDAAVASLKPCLRVESSAARSVRRWH